MAGRDPDQDHSCFGIDVVERGVETGELFGAVFPQPEHVDGGGGVGQGCEPADPFPIAFEQSAQSFPLLKIMRFRRTALCRFRIISRRAFKSYVGRIASMPETVFSVPRGASGKAARFARRRSGSFRRPDDFPCLYASVDDVEEGMRFHRFERLEFPVPLRVAGF